MSFNLIIFYSMFGCTDAVRTAAPLQNCPLSGTAIPAGYTEYYGKWYKVVTDENYPQHKAVYSDCKAVGAKMVEPRTLMDFYALRWLLIGKYRKHIPFSLFQFRNLFFFQRGIYSSHYAQ